jgi:hypothetical protein
VFVQFEGAHFRGSVEWWIVIVPRSVLGSESRCEEIRAAFERQFRRPGILMAQETSGKPIYWGRPDLIDRMASILLNDIRWQRFALIAD